MARLTHEKLEQLSEVIREIYAQQSPETLRQAIVDSTARLVAADSVSFNEVDPWTQAVTVVHNGGYSAELVGTLLPALTAHLQEHPIHQYRLATRSDQALKLTDFLSDQGFQATGLYNEFYRPLEIRRVLAIYLPSAGILESPVCLFRKGRDFSESDRFVLNLLGRHFSQAYANVAAMRRLAVSAQLHESAMATLRQGFIRAKTDHRIDEMTPLCGELMRRYFDAKPGDINKLPDHLRSWLQHQAQTQKADLNAGPALMTLNGADGRLHVRLVSRDAEGVVLFLHEVRRRAPDFQALGLTQREFEVLEWLEEGKSNPEIATILGISVRTIHKHVERILAKFAVETRQSAASVLREWRGKG